MPNFIDLTKQKFHRLKVISRAENGKNGRVRWNCICKCGNKTTPIGKDLRSGHTRSCGCLQRETITKIQTTHNLWGSREYVSWANMRQRCNNPKHLTYKNYGGRGIKVCKRWDQFENFLADMGERPKGYTLERKNNNKGYSPKNCKWATRAEQKRNSRSTHNITYNGITMCHTDWSRYLGGCDSLVPERLIRGWTPEQAVSTPIKK